MNWKVLLWASCYLNISLGVFFDWLLCWSDIGNVFGVRLTALASHLNYFQLHHHHVCLHFSPPIPELTSLAMNINEIDYCVGTALSMILGMGGQHWQYILEVWLICCLLFSFNFNFYDWHCPVQRACSLYSSFQAQAIMEGAGVCVVDHFVQHWQCILEGLLIFCLLFLFDFNFHSQYTAKKSLVYVYQMPCADVYRTFFLL